MLKIYYGELESDDYIFNPDSYFNNTYEDEWITSPLSVEMIKDVDGSDVIGPRSIDSPFLGSIPTERLSGGVKTLILMSKDNQHIFNASACVDNCAGFVGMRSGLCDIVSSTSTKMVVYHKEFCFNQFSLERMGLKTNNILELCIDKLPEEVVIEKTMEYMIEKHNKT